MNERVYRVSVWCARWQDNDAHPTEPWGIGFPGYEGGGEVSLCVHCERRRLAELADKASSAEAERATELGQVPDAAGIVTTPTQG